MTLRACLLSLCWLMSAISAMAQETPATVPAETGGQAAELPVEQRPVPDYLVDDQDPQKKELRGYKGPSLFDMFGKLLLVLGLIMLLAWLVQKYLPKRLGVLGEGKQLKLLQNLPLGQRRFVSLIEADGKRFLLGVTDNQITLIKALDEMPFDRALGIDEPKTVRELWEENP